MKKTDRSVVRNQAYTKASFSVRERHNERKNESYYNSDIHPERQNLNVYFKKCEGSYAEQFEAMLAAGAINTRGLKTDAKVFNEFVFDVNSAYFERNGGYEFAKSFFEEAYRCAVKEIGGEQYVLSAVMHADERNKALSSELGSDIYHFHLHVIYIPVVDKEVLWSKRCKDPALVGKVKEVIKQVSHSKKWPRFKENGRWINSYSLLQDRFHEHMRNAGFTGFERGERGSTAEHLSVLEYKSQQEAKRAAALDTAIIGKEQVIADLDEQAAKKQKKVDRLSDEINVKAKAALTVAEIEAMGKPALLGGVNVAADDMKKLKTLAKKSLAAHESVSNMKHKLAAAENELCELKTQLDKEKKARPSVMEHLSIINKFMAALKRAPKRLLSVIEDIMRQPPERQEPERMSPERASPERKHRSGIEY